MRIHLAPRRRNNEYEQIAMKVSVIILNWNSKDFIEECIRSVLRQSFSSIEVIVVDNASRDGSFELISSKFGHKIKLIRNEQNFGFAEGMNRGIALAQGEYLLLLNSDVFLKEDYIERVVERFMVDVKKEIGVIGGKLYLCTEERESNQIDHVGFFLKARMAVTNSHNQSQEEFVFGSSGACPTIRKETLSDIALSSEQWFDKDYFAYNEDIDLWFRCQLRGWRVLFLPTAEGWHVHSGSVGGKQRLFERSDELQFHALKNRYMTILKNYPSPLFILMLPMLLLVEVAVVLYVGFYHPQSLKNLRRAWAYVFKNRESILRRRRIIQSRRVVSTKYLLQFFKNI